jgi:hypothetical protein
MRLGWAIVAGLAVGAAAWWWSTREEREHARIERERRAAIEAEAVRPVLYRWRDANGVLHVTDAPPKQGKYERVHLDQDAAIEVRGDR